MTTFAEGLTEIMARKKQESKERDKIAAKWQAHEDQLIEVAVEKFKNRCLKEAENQKCQATISFEVLTREIPNFPKYAIKDSTYLVDSWGDAAAAWWFYSHHGTKSEWTSGTPILFAEMLESMMPKFLTQVKTLGFDSCQREPGTWKVTAAWSLPGSDGASDEQAAKKSKKDKEAPPAAAPKASSKKRASPPARTPTPTDQPTSDVDA
mmetsp:Transcript_33317/g.53022  ORF Transcript_33317/g.53022 Transcript_33317/m.53022 type:complete len:208 (-) Transcript_33317:114-737(-)